MRKIIYTLNLIILISIFSLITNLNTCYASLNATYTTNENNLNIYSRRAIVFERNSKVVLYSKNINERCAMASTTKIMTSIIVLENTNLNDIVTVSKKAAGTGGSRLGLKKDDKIKVKDLLYGLMLCSGNDAAVALAEYTAGSIEDFAFMMNKKALELGLKNTHFEVPHGLDNENHFTTAYELSLIMDYALKNKQFTDIVGTKKTTVYINNNPKQISNTNELLGKLGVYGGKTGYTGNAGRCLVTVSKNNDLDIITIVLGSDTKKIRTTDSEKLIKYAFENYELIDLSTYIKEEYKKISNRYLKNVHIDKSYKTNIKIDLDNLKYTKYPVRKDSLKDVVVKENKSIKLKAPISRGTILTSMSIYIDGKYIFSTDILANENINKKSFFEYIYFFFKNFKNILNNGYIEIDF